MRPVDRTPVNLAVDVGGVRLKNPVLCASGTCGYGEEYAGYYDIACLGGVVVKGLSIKPRPGNPTPRVAETPAGMLNAIGLENIGVERFIAEKLPPLRRSDTAVIANIFGETVEEYAAVAARLDSVDGVGGLELNISCPNVSAGGMSFGGSASAAYEVVNAVRRSTRLPLWVKLSPNAASITEIAQAAVEAGADALSLVNTFLGLAVDVEARRPKLANITGGLSGPAIRPLAVYLVWRVARAVGVPVVGIGGIMCAEDALEFIIAGAAAVQVGTASFVDPRAPIDILAGINEYLARHGYEDINHLRGSLKA